MMILAIGVELANVVTAQRPHDADPRKHCRARGLLVKRRRRLFGKRNRQRLAAHARRLKQ
jgi:hypothetical protein